MTVTPEHRGRAGSPGRPAPSLLRPGLLAVVAAAVAAGVVHVVFDVLGADYVVEPPGQARTTVALGLAVGVAAGCALVGSGIAAVAARRSRRPERVVTGLALLGLVLFAVNPVVAAEQGLTVVALEVMHLAVAGAWLAVLLPALRRPRP
jgi:Family of unknown function (DUF6069)